MGTREHAQLFFHGNHGSSRELGVLSGARRLFDESGDASKPKEVADFE